MTHLLAPGYTPSDPSATYRIHCAPCDYTYSSADITLSPYARHDWRCPRCRRTPIEQESARAWDRTVAPEPRNPSGRAGTPGKQYHVGILRELAAAPKGMTCAELNARIGMEMATNLYKYLTPMVRAGLVIAVEPPPVGQKKLSRRFFLGRVAA